MFKQDYIQFFKSLSMELKYFFGSFINEASYHYYFLWFLSSFAFLYLYFVFIDKLSFSQIKQRLADYVFSKRVQTEFYKDLYFIAIKFLYKPFVIGFLAFNFYEINAFFEKSVLVDIFQMSEPVIQMKGFPGAFLTGILLFLYLDLCSFVRHYITHKVKWLWYFHMTHHMATSLSPLTKTREHPLYHIFNMSLRIILAFPGTLFIFSLIGSNQESSDLIVLVLALIFFQFNLHLRHSPFPISYGFLDKVLMSPYMHQVHHSKLEKHWDKNFGVALSIWDRMAGTLYIPAKGESLEFGVDTPFEIKGDISSGFYDLMLPYFLIKKDLFSRRSAGKRAVELKKNAA